MPPRTLRHIFQVTAATRVCVGRYAGTWNDASIELTKMPLTGKVYGALRIAGPPPRSTGRGFCWPYAAPCRDCGKHMSAVAPDPPTPSSTAKLHLDPFAGLGAFRVATEFLGFSTALANDICEAALELYRTNEAGAKATIVCDSIRDLRWWSAAALLGAILPSRCLETKCPQGER